MTVGTVSPLRGGHSGSAGPFADRKSSCPIPTRVSAAATAGSRRDRSRCGGTPASCTRSAGRLWSTCLRRRTSQEKHAHPDDRFVGGCGAGPCEQWPRRSPQNSALNLWHVELRPDLLLAIDTATEAFSHGRCHLLARRYRSSGSAGQSVDLLGDE